MLSNRRCFKTFVILQNITNQSSNIYVGKENKITSWERKHVGKENKLNEFALTRSSKLICQCIVSCFWCPIRRGGESATSATCAIAEVALLFLTF